MRSRPRASVEHPLDTARLVLGFLDPGEGFSVGPGLPSFTRGSRIAPPSIIPVAHRTSAVEVLYCSAHLDRMEMLVPVLPALPAPLPRAPRSVVFNGLYSTAKYHTIKYTIAIAALAVRPIATMMTTNQLLLVVGGYFLTTDYSQLHVVIRQRVSRRPQQQQMLDINSSSSSSAILARSNHPSSVARYQPTRATVAANPPSMDDAQCFAELLLPSDQQNPINGAMALDHPSGHFAVRILGSGLARTLPDSGNYCPSIPGTTCCWPVLGDMGLQNDRVWNGYRQRQSNQRRDPEFATATARQLICVK
ncbi:hypothetical protein An02g12570 [Aspergillus niger]|uniref:Uncharacterized protein n=2 Tax=Aspergillus niger TaxID=5061 RepID=A2QEX7_ASPNC|nr:hypothetical protein An02g12570 [Aspergillus niger]CAK44527.1 hypothetical protein An02g12570 [Aspergillus niger]